MVSEAYDQPVCQNSTTGLPDFALGVYNYNIEIKEYNACM